MSEDHKLDRVVTYLLGILFIKSHDLLISCFCKITWQTKNIDSPIRQYLRLPNLSEL